MRGSGRRVDTESPFRVTCVVKCEPDRRLGGWTLFLRSLENKPPSTWFSAKRRGTDQGPRGGRPGQQARLVPVSALALWPPLCEGPVIHVSRVSVTVATEARPKAGTVAAWSRPVLFSAAITCGEGQHTQ